MSFDPQTFLNTQFEPVPDEYVPFPEDEYLGQIEKLDVRSGKIKDGDHAGEEWVMLDIQFRPIGQKAEEAARAVGLREIPLVRYSMFLDLDENGKLRRGPNENVRLGKLLTACGLNEGSWSPFQLQGQTCTIVVYHRTNEDTGDVYAEVKSVGMAS